MTDWSAYNLTGKLSGGSSPFTSTSKETWLQIDPSELTSVDVLSGVGKYPGPIAINHVTKRSQQKETVA